MLTKKRELGKSGLMVSALGMGCMGFISFVSVKRRTTHKLPAL